MFSISLATDGLLSQKTDCYAYIVEKGFDISLLNEVTHHGCSEHDDCSDIVAVLKQRKFMGNLQEVISIPFPSEDRVEYCIIVGMGDENSAKGINRTERYRRALGQLVKEVRACKGTSVAIALPECKDSSFYCVEQAVITLQMAYYQFDDYKTDKKQKENALSQVVLIIDEQYKQEAEQAITEGNIIAKAVNQARHWVDMPPSSLTPQDLAKKAEEVAHRNNLNITVFHEQEVIKMGMGGLAAVSRGSEIDCALIILEYKSPKIDAPTLCFVGKGITFDSGGLSLKPAEYMETMKDDMSGAAAVISAIDALAQLKPDINIIAIAPTSENLPSGRATKPGDIVTFYNGKTAEIRNTDAEGRLILADALSYAVKHYKPDAIVDLATLTGACSRALGPVYSGLFSEYEDLIKKLYDAAEISGDRLWQLPMGYEYKKAISSKVADICNIGSKQIMAGASTAAHFLQYFVDDVTWAHIDIAGTAFDVPNVPYYDTGATGVGVRLLIALAMNWKK